MHRGNRVAPYDGLSATPEQVENIEVTNLEINYDLDWASLASLSSWVKGEARYVQELSGYNIISELFPWTASEANTSDVFTEELRLTSQLDGPLQFLLGFYYEDREITYDNLGLWAGDPALNPFAVNTILLRHDYRVDTLEQKAWFGEVSYSFEETLKFTLGFRTFEYDKENLDQDFAAPSGFTTDQISTTTLEEEDNTFKAAIEYTPDNDSLYYLSWAEGFRIGRSLPGLSNPSCDADEDGLIDGSSYSMGARELDSDLVENIEFGAKLSFLDNRLQVSATAYKMDWTGLPVLVFLGNNQCNVTVNGGEAELTGLELDTSYYIGENLLFTLSGSYVNAELSKDSSIGSAGDRLPGSAEYNLQAGLEYGFDLYGNPAFIRSDYGYVGGYYNRLAEVGDELGKFGKLNLRVGTTLSSVNVELYVNNLTNENNFTWIDANSVGVGQNTRGYQTRPRTIGLDLTYQF